MKSEVQRTQRFHEPFISLSSGFPTFAVQTGERMSPTVVNSVPESHDDPDASAFAATDREFTIEARGPAKR
jgi:hypothetical protein